jgi:uncharacterized lipoprotein YmbA
MKSVSVLLCMLLSACSIGQAPPVPTLFLVEPTPINATKSSAFSREVIRMGLVRVAAEFSGASLVYRRNDVTFLSDPYNGFVTDPALMLSGRIAGWLDASGAFGGVLQPGSGQPTRYVLEATVTELYGDFRPDQAPAAVLTIQFSLMDSRAASLTTKFSRTYRRRVGLTEASPTSLARGWALGLTEILSVLITDLEANRSSYALVSAGENP